MENRSTSFRVDRADGTARLVAALGDWSVGRGPLYRQLSRAVAALVERGELAGGARLPAERALAGAVAVSRGVVVAAYDELVATGVAERRPGSGTFVATRLDLPPAGREGTALVGALVDQGRDRGRELAIDLSISVLHEARDLPDVAVSTAQLGSVAADSPWGLPELRVRIAERLTAIGLPSEPDQVVVTTGAQQGISAAVGCWVRPGDRVVVDDPTYPGVLSAVAAAGAIAVPVPVDEHGPVLAALEAALAGGPALLYVQSGPHSPTGGRLSGHRRDVIARWARQARIPVVEDLALHALDWSARRPETPLAARLGSHPSAVVGSYSKRFWAGLRVGFVRAPEPVAQRLVRVKATHDLGSSTVSQAMALALLDHPRHERSMAHRRASLAERSELLVRLLAEHLPAWQVAPPDGGLSLWVRLPGPFAAALAREAAARGVVVATAEGLSAQPGHHLDRIRLTFALPKRDLRTAVDRLAAAWSEIASMGVVGQP